MSRTRLLRLSVLMLLAGCCGLLAAVVWHNWGDLLWTHPPSVDAGPGTDAGTLRRGQELLRAGNCIACHTARGGTALAGGRPLETPFGTVYSSNLTPDPETGLGHWRAQDFWNALHHGRSRDARLLIPAFPYDHTSVITREDSDAMFAWLQSVPAVHQTTPAHNLSWPLGTQPALAVWRTLFFERRPFRPDPGQSAAWNRGAYLVLGLGHCAACHSPRNAWGATPAIHDLSGGKMPVANWYAPSLVDDRETGLASTPLQDIVRLLQTGQGPKASTSGPMAEVVQHSLQHLHPEDLQAIAVYLQSRARDSAPATRRATPAPLHPGVADLGLRVYERHCASCHGSQGQGVPDIYPALAGNRAVLLGDPTNLVQSLLYGGYGPATRGHPRPFGMPPFVLELGDHEVAAVLSHVRMALQITADQAGEVTPLQVNRVRAENGR